MSLQAAFSICALTIAIFLLGLFGLWVPFVLTVSFVVLVVLTVYTSNASAKEIFSLHKSSFFHRLVIFFTVITFVIYFVGVFTPETGFDALWYHLPLIREYSALHRLTYDVQYYQSLYPQYADGLLLLGFSTFDVIGAKSVSFIFFLLLFVVVYDWLRDKVASKEALVGTLLISLSQVVSWQSSSAYVDVISCFFFLVSTKFLIAHKKAKKPFVSIVISGLAMGIFLGTKFVNLGFLPLLVLTSWVLLFLPFEQREFKRKLQSFGLYWLVIFLVAAPWYLRAWWFTGSLIFPIGTIYAVPVIRQMGVNGWSEWLGFRLNQLWRAPYEFFFLNDGYVTPLLLFFSPIILLKKSWSTEFLMGVVSGVYGILFWFFFPPPSTRYVLGPVLFCWIVVYSSFFQLLKGKKMLTRFTEFACIINVLIFLLVRIFISTRSVPYLLHWENEQQYLARFRNGFLDEKIDNFYGK